MPKKVTKNKVLIEAGLLTIFVNKTMVYSRILIYLNFVGSAQKCAETML